MVDKTELLKLCAAGDFPGAAQRSQLETEILANQRQSRAFGITTQNIQEVVEQRSQLLQVIYSKLEACQSDLKISECLIEPLWDIWLPLALWLAQQRKELQQPLVQGIVGGQGAGKTTLGVVLKLILPHLGYTCLSISLDDFYKTYAERMQMRSQDPRLIWRGPPGTHDVQLAIEVLDKLKHPDGQLIAVPRFDKTAYEGAGDRNKPELVEQADIILLEGWFVGVQPLPADVASAIFAAAPPPITTQDDQVFALDMNANLATYLPLWQRLDSLILLYVQDYQLSKQWRQQAESKAMKAGNSGMSKADIDQFVDYFWRSLHPDIFIKPLRSNSQLVNLVIEINAKHLPVEVYRPSDC